MVHLMVTGDEGLELRPHEWPANRGRTIRRQRFQFLCRVWNAWEVHPLNDTHTVTCRRCAELALRLTWDQVRTLRITDVKRSGLSAQACDGCGTVGERHVRITFVHVGDQYVCDTCTKQAIEGRQFDVFNREVGG